MNSRFVFVYNIIGRKYRFRRKVAVVAKNYQTALSLCDSFLRDNFPDALDFLTLSYSVEYLVESPHFTES